MDENQNLWMWVQWLGSATSWLRQRANGFIDYQNQSRQAHVDAFNAQNDNQIKAIHNEWMNATNHWVAQECNRTTRLQSVAKWIRDYYWNSRGKDYSWVEDVPLVDAYIKANPTSKKPIYAFILDESDLCDPIPLYEQMGWIEKEMQEEASIAEPMFDPTWSRLWLVTPDTEVWTRNELTSWSEWWETGKEKLETFADNFWKSFENFVKDIWDIIEHPGEVLKSLVQLPVWVWANITNSDDYIEYMTNERVKKFYEEANALADWAWDYIIDRWRWRDEDWNLNSLKDWLATMGNTLYSDPVWWIDDLLAVVEWWASLTDNALRWIAKFSTNPENLLDAAHTAWKISDVAEAISPSGMVTHPVRTMKAGKKLAGKAWNAVADTKPGRALWELIENTTKKISDYVAQSERMKKLKSFANTKRWKIVFPEAHDIYMDLTPTSPEFKAKFAREYGVDYADHLNKHGIVWGPEEVVDRLQYENDKLYKNVTEAVKEMKDPINVEWNKYVEEMLKYNISHAYYTMDRSGALWKMLEVFNKYMNTGTIDPQDLLFNKRYFERKTKFSYGWKDVAPEKWDRATNIDNEIREILLKAADEQWATNLREVSKSIWMNKSIIDAIWENAMKKHHGWKLWLSDYILMVSWADNSVITRTMLKRVLDSDWFKKLQLKYWNKLRDIIPEGFSEVDLDEIRKTNADNRVQRQYDFAMWDWTPRLTDSVQWWVEATDNAWWANMRAEDAIAYADRVIETYLHSPWDVEKKVVEWVPVDSSKWIRKAKKSWSTKTSTATSAETTKAVKPEIVDSSTVTKDWRQDPLFN